MNPVWLVTKTISSESYLRYTVTINPLPFALSSVRLHTDTHPFIIIWFNRLRIVAQPFIFGVKTDC